MADQREKPILFSGAMVRAILDGRKTQTRRVFVPPPPFAVGDDIAVEIATGSIAPRFVVGDRLWVREAHYLTDDGHDELVVYAEDAAAVKEHLADIAKLEASHTSFDWSRHKRLRPSIHMPRWASRITLEVTGVKVERLQDISEADAKAEGMVFTDFGTYQPPGEASIDGGQSFHPFKPRQHDGWHWGNATHPDQCLATARSAFANLWSDINGPGSWDANPWVVAISFRRIEPATEPR